MTAQTHRARRTWRPRLTGLGAFVMILALVVGLPVTLLAVGSTPAPHSLPTLEQVRAALTSPDDGTVALAALTLVAWATWLFLTGAIAADIVARLRGVHVPPLPGLHLPQAAVHGLVGAAILLFAAPLHPLSMATSGMDVPVRASLQTVAPPAATAATNPGLTRTAGADAKSARSPVAGSRLHTVAPGETLWSIAEHHLGAGARYHEIVQLNEDVIGPNPRFLRVGEVLLLPTVGATTPDGPPLDETHEVTVRPGDTLSQIALEELGRADRYPEIVTASADTLQPDGGHLRHPDLIRPGWELTIPTPEVGRGPATAAPTRQTQLSQEAGRSVPTHVTDPPQGSAPAPSTVRGHREAAQPSESPAAAPGTQSNASPSQARGAASSREDGQSGADTAQQDQTGHPSWELTGLTGGGALLAGAMLLLLRRRRRTQFRMRRPGRTIATPEPLLAPVEKTLADVGGTTGSHVELLDDILRRLAARTAHEQTPMPQLAAVELAHDRLTLHLAAPASLAHPWAAGIDQTHWALSLDQQDQLDQMDQQGWEHSVLEAVGPVVRDQPAPYPLLVTIGTSDEGHVWLLNLEDLAVTITGDPTYGRDFARYLVAEIACNPWSHRVHVDLVGVAHEVAPMNTDRIHIRSDPRVRQQDGSSSEAEDPAAATLTAARTLIERSTDAGVNLSTARAHQTGADPWPARLMLIDLSRASDIQETDRADDGDADPTGPGAGREDQLSQLLDVVVRHAGQTGTSVVLLGDAERSPGLTLRATADGRLLLPHTGLDLIAVGLTSDEAQGCAALLAQSQEVEDAPIPATAEVSDGWRGWADDAGALRDEHCRGRHDPSADVANRDTEVTTSTDVEDDEQAVSVLDHADEDYIRAGATTQRDLDMLAPKVPERVRGAVADADPSLDDDLAMWWDDDCPLPRLALLGPVWARAADEAPTKQVAYLTEVLTFLATRPHGATPDEVTDQFDVSPTKARDYVNRVREWLGVNPRTGESHVPDARRTPAARDRGVSVYQVLDLLVDVDLFRRLRLRGMTRGPDGIEDLRHALSLVRGRPFDQLRPGGWSWLYEGDRLDHHMVCAVVDVAHLVTTASLQAGDRQLARLAAETAAAAAPDEEIPRMDLAAVATSEGLHHEAARILREEACNRTDDDDAPPELSDRTREILTARDWETKTWRAS